MKACEEEPQKEEDKTETKQKTVKINNIPFIGLVSFTALLGFYFAWALSTNRITAESTGVLFSKTFYIITIIALAVLSIWEFLRKRPDHPFRDVRFVFFIFALIPVQTLFAHNWLTLPYYLDRAFVGTVVGDYFEVFSNLNPLLIFILAPLIAALTTRANVYKMMIYGTFVMAVPTFLLATGPNVTTLLAYIVLMTIGEAMWQPRFLQWIAEIAPEGKTGAYMGIGQLPWFLTKVLTSLYSGYFVANYVPKPDSGMALRTGEMWFIYAIIAMVSPVVLVIARKWMARGMNEKAE